VKRIPSWLLDPDAGRVLVLIVCPECGSKVIGVVQERWNIETPRGELMDAWNLRVITGKTGRGDQSSGSPLQKGGPVGHPERTVQCRRHGPMLVDKGELVSAAAVVTTTPRVVVARTQQRLLE
jgi:hypothetical protein